MSLSNDGSLFSEHGKKGKTAATAVLSPKLGQFQIIFIFTTILHVGNDHLFVPIIRVMWILKANDPLTDLKDGDIRKRLILHAQHVSTMALLQAQQDTKHESEFERQVFKRLQQAGYHVIAQWPVGAYRIDLVVEGDGKRLAIECDGDRWHPHEKLEEDMARQAILERLGWRFVRIRGSHFFRHPDQAMAPVFARLCALEIPPITPTSVPEPPMQQHHELRDHIIRRAAELRVSWAQN